MSAESLSPVGIADDQPTAIEALQEAHAEQQAIVDLQERLNLAPTPQALIHAAVDFLHDWLNCDAVGIRLRDGEDYPYFETRGFPREFVQSENCLCSVDDQGQLLRDRDGNPVLECMCGNVICGRFDPSKPFFTKRGSFWSNGTSALLAETSEADRQARTRNRCNGEGYESVGLFPLHVGTEAYGLLQINAKRKDLFTPGIVACLERLGAFVAVALAQRRGEESLREFAEAQELLLREVNHRVKNNLASIMGMLQLEKKRPDREDERSILNPALDRVLSRVRGLFTVHSMLTATGWRPLKLSALCTEVVRGCWKNAPTSRTLELDINESPVSIGSRDAHHVALVVCELATNTMIHATAEPAASRVTIAVAQDGELVKLRFRDNGPGFPERLLRADEPTAGVGYGLIYGIVRRSLHGEIHLHNNGGAVVDISFPAGRDPAGAEAD